MPDSRNWFPDIPEARRRRFPATKREGVLIHVDGMELVNFASNDYLGLSFHPQVCQAAASAILDAVGSGASRLITGDDPLLHRLEQKLAEWKGYEACLIAGSGMLANIGLLQALADRHSHIFSDRLNHASLVDGARLSGAKSHRYHHLDQTALATQLEKHAAERRIIVSDGIFSMDGDSSDAATLMQLAETHDTLLLIDDAHGTGTVGPEGRGVTAAAGIAGHPRLIEVGTFGKAFGSYGAFILGTHELIEGLRQRQRTVIYSTALPVAVVAAAEAALELIRQGELLAQLQGNLVLFRQKMAGIGFMDSSSPIQPLMIGRDATTLALATELRKHGYFVPAIRPPTVPEGTARLRFTVTAAHSAGQIEQLAATLRALL